MVKLPIVDHVISLVRKSGPPPQVSVPSHERFRTGFEQSPVGVAFIATDGQWLHFNERFQEIAGYSREQLGRLSFHDLTHPDDAKAEVVLVKRLLRGDLPSYRMTKRIIEKKGKYREVEVVVSLVHDDGAPDFLIYVVDERPRPGRGAGREAEQSLTSAIDQMTDIAVIRTDDRGVITGWNAGAERIFGYRRDEIVGRPRRMLYRDPDNWEGRSTQQLAAAIDGGRIEMEDWRVAKDGSHFWVRTSITPMRPDGSVKGYLEVISAPGGRDAGISQQTREVSDARTAELRQTIDVLRAELMKRERTEESLRHALEELRVVGEETMDELKIMTDALRKEMERRKASESELRAVQAKAAAPPPAPLPEEELLSAAHPPSRKWKPLGKTSPAELLIAHASEQHTGRLIVSSGSREKEIFFEKGRIFSCASNDPARFLAQRLVTMGVISEEQRQKALEIQRETHLALGRILVILGAVSEERLLEAMRFKAEEEIAELFIWRDARYVFVEGAIPTLQLVPLRIEVAELVVQQMQRRRPALTDAIVDLPQDNELATIDVTRIVDEAVSDLVMDDIADVANEIEHNIESIASRAEILVASVSAKTKKFHRASCSTARRFAEETRVVFLSADDAERAGYEACRMCFRES